VSIRVDGTNEVAANFTRLEGKAVTNTTKIVRVHAQLLLTRIQANASGRPGPRIITGDYKRSWNVRFLGGIVNPTAEVGTSAPQARRLEYGFVGTDSLGRFYHQPPFPHVRPAIQYITPLFVRAMGRVLE
jgi:hypothetical protein